MTIIVYLVFGLLEPFLSEQRLMYGYDYKQLGGKKDSVGTNITFIIGRKVRITE